MNFFALAAAAIFLTYSLPAASQQTFFLPDQRSDATTTG